MRVQGLLDALRAAVATLTAEDAANNPPDSGIAVTVKVNTASQKAMEKMERKAQRKAQARSSKGDHLTNDYNYARNVGWAALQVWQLSSCACIFGLFCHFFCCCDT